nr:hypothetical protein [Deinococcus sp. YIM 77859]
MKDLGNDAVGEAVAVAAEVMLFQSGEVLGPFLAITSGDLRVLELQADVLEVVPEGLAREALDVLEDEGAGSRLADGADGLREHVAGVVVPGVLPANAEWLAGRTAGHEVHALVTIEAQVAYVTLNDRPVTDDGEAAFLVFADCLAGVAVPLGDEARVEARVRDALRESARADEEFDAAEVGGHVTGYLTRKTLTVALGFTGAPATWDRRGLVRLHHLPAKQVNPPRDFLGLQAAIPHQLPDASGRDAKRGRHLLGR